MSSSVSCNRVSISPRKTAHNIRLSAPVRGDIVQTLPGCVDYDEVCTSREVPADRLGVITCDASPAGWVKAEWQAGSESGKIGTTPCGPSSHVGLRNLSGEERQLIVARYSGDEEASLQLDNLRAEYSALSTETHLTHQGQQLEADYARETRRTLIPRLNLVE